jgi:hypothetical protein
MTQSIEIRKIIPPAFEHSHLGEKNSMLSPHETWDA